MRIKPPVVRFWAAQDSVGDSLVSAAGQMNPLLGALTLTSPKCTYLAPKVCLCFHYGQEGLLLNMVNYMTA